jgi:hypothetical protein
MATRICPYCGQEKNAQGFHFHEITCRDKTRLETLKKTALVDISASTTISEEVDLGAAFKYLLVLIPTITASTVTVHVSDVTGGTFYPLYEIKTQIAADVYGDFPFLTTSATTAHSVIFMIGGAQYIKIVCGSAQTVTDKTFTVRGFN